MEDKVSPCTERTERAPRVGRGFFPLDEELGLLPGNLAPPQHEHVVQQAGLDAVCLGRADARPRAGSPGERRDRASTG